MTYEYKCPSCGASFTLRNQPISAETAKCQCGGEARRNPVNAVPFTPCKGMYSYYYQNRPGEM